MRLNALECLSFLSRDSHDAARRTNGRKRHILVDAAGLVLLVHVHAADLHDRLGAQLLVARAGTGELPRLRLVWADGAYAGTFARLLETERGWRVEVPTHRDRHLLRDGPETLLLPSPVCGVGTLAVARNACDPGQEYY